MKKLNPISSHCPQHGIRAVESPLWWYGYFIMGQQYKKCTKCDKIKPVFEFDKDKSRKDGLKGQCKECIRENTIKHNKENKDKIKEQKRKYHQKNKHRINERGKKYREKNKEYYKERKNKWDEKNKEYCKKYRQDNRDRINKNASKYHKKRRKNDPLFKLQYNTRCLVGSSFKKQGYTKNSKTYKILGIGYDGLLNWLNDEASNGLNYENDDVHIDHVIPMSLAQTEEEALLLNHYSNLQLLNPEDNLLKKNNYIYEENLNRALNYHTNSEILNDIVNRSKIKIIER